MARTKKPEKSLTQVWAERGVAAIQQKVTLKGCPLCQQTNWDADAKCIVTTEAGGDLESPPSVIPVLLLVCNNCGYLMTYSLVKLGVVLKPEG